MGAKTDIAIALRGVTNRFGPQVVHENLDLDVFKGEVIGVVGGSGTGKSVLLRTILGLRTPQAGSVRVFGTEIIGASDATRSAVERRVGVLFQNGALFSSLTVAENVQVPIKEHVKIEPPLLDEIAADKIRLAGLPPEAGAKYPSELSGGMVKRAALARALALDAEILFLDEPTSGLDPVSAAAFDQLIRSLQATLGLTVYMVTHDLDSLNTSCDRIAVLADRHVVKVGSWDEVLAFDHPWVREYFHGPRARAVGGHSSDSPSANGKE